MNVLLSTLAGLLVGVLAIWLLVAMVILIRRPDPSVVRAVAAIPLDVVCFVRKLLADPVVPRGAKMLLWLLLAYLVMPIDLIPDFIPVAGYADDVIMISLLLGAAIRRAGGGRLEQDWPGSDAGRDAVARLCRL